MYIVLSPSFVGSFYPPSLQLLGRSISNLRFLPSVMLLTFALLALGLARLAVAKTVNYDWDITWVRAAPDGVERNVIGINGEWPCPQIDVDVGDKVIVHMNNALGNQSTTIHWHGLHQNGTPEMDGASGITQCPVPPGQSFTYEFMASSA
jgi:iron transport multicopper oxidase